MDDPSYRLTHVKQYPMYQMNLTNILNEYPSRILQGSHCGAYGPQAFRRITVTGPDVRQEQWDEPFKHSDLF